MNSFDLNTARRHTSESVDLDHLRQTIAPHLETLYPDDCAAVTDRLIEVVKKWLAEMPREKVKLPDESTAYLIAYGDSFHRDDQLPLQTLADVLRSWVGGGITDLHLLPIYPWTSDDGFAVVDYRKVDAELGAWSDIRELASDYHITLDFVANHVSKSSAWFKAWLAGDHAYDGFFLEPDSRFDVSHVVRPRVTPLTHDYRRSDGSVVSVWTTFGDDQIDLDPSTPAVLINLTDIFLGYVAHGATTIRLDAIGYLWKESGTSCINLPQTHLVIKIWRAIVDEIAPGVRLLTETNVPEQDNIRYFGNGSDEANLIYQFALPPLVLHAFVSGSAHKLADWARGIRPVSPNATWFNFLASHDGIGLRPVEGILDRGDMAQLIGRTKAVGGEVSMARKANGDEDVYELNTSYIEALVGAEEKNRDKAVVDAGLAAHAILLSLMGVPAIYYRSLFGSGQNRAAVEETRIPRRINRGSLSANDIGTQREAPAMRSAMLRGILALLETRKTLTAFSPFAAQEILNSDDRLFAVRRIPETGSIITAVINVSDETVEAAGLKGIDVLTGRSYTSLVLGPKEFVWLRQ